jgi:predicted extracellular nuclease
MFVSTSPTGRRAATLALSLALLIGLVPGGGASAATGDPVLLNEILGSTSGSDSEYIELYGDPGAALGGLSVISVESDASASNGEIEFRVDLPAGAVLGTNGFYLLANGLAASTYGVTPNQAIVGSIENSSYTIALVETASLAGDVGTFLTGSEQVLDSLGLTDGETAESFHFDAPVIGPDTAGFLPAGGRRLVDGRDTDAPEDWAFADFNNGDENTPTAGTFDGDPDPEPGTPCEVPVEDLTAIHEIQGSGAATPINGTEVVTRGVVTADFTSGGDSGIPANQGLRGFFIEATATDRDDDAATSEGLFVFDADGVFDGSIGDPVAVAGTAGEGFGVTQVTLEAFEVCEEASGDLPPAAELTLPLAPADRDAAWEPTESMRVTHTELTVTEFFQLERFGEIRLSADGVLQTPTNVHLPGSSEAEELLADNLAALIILDDGRTGQNLNRLSGDSLLPYVEEGGTLRIGDQLLDETFVLHFGFGAWRLQPVDIDALTDALADNRTRPRPQDPPDVGGTLQVASFNVLNYFNGDGQGGGFPTARGAITQSELDRQTTKLVDAILRLEADVYGLIEIENDGGPHQAVETLVEALNAEVGSETFRFVDTGVIGTDEIKQAFIYRRSTVRPVGDFALLTSEVDPRFDDSRSRPALAQTFLRLGSGERVTVVVNHFKSKGQSELEDPTSPDFDQGDGQGFWNFTRTQSALALADWLESNPTKVQSLGSLIIGDLNAYAREDPIRALEDAGFVDQLRHFTDGIPYTFTFDGMQGTLDTALARGTVASRVTGAAVWHINADEVPAIDYLEAGPTSLGRFRTPEIAAAYYDPTAFRSSDHDPVLIGLDLDRSKYARRR